jgi:predicted transcriptional regulator
MPVSLLPLAVSSADLLRAVDAGGWVTKAELAESVGKAPNNIARDLAGLERAGLIEQDRRPDASRPLRLTELGQEQLAAIGRAEHGGEKRKPRGRWPLDRIVRNPANRMPLAENVATRADTIEAAGDVLQEVLLTPPDANGDRMLLAGEHRWRAALNLRRAGRLPAALEAGIPFREREATDAERILISIVENTQVALTPLQDARQLLALQEATGWSAREIAKKTGRSPEGSETGVRDVQSKIKVAREATPEALAEHEAGRLDWHQLRETVMQPKPRAEPQVDDEDLQIPGFLRRLADDDTASPAPAVPAPPAPAPEVAHTSDPLVVNGIRYPNLTRANDAKRAAGLLPRLANHGGGARPAAAAPPAAPAPAASDGEDLPWDAKPSEDDVDEWDRDHNARVADQAVLRRAEDFVGGLTSGGDEQAWRLLHQGIGVAGPFTAQDGIISAEVAGKLQPQPIITVDVNAEWPPERAQALALVVAWTLQQRFGPEARK